MKKLWKLMVLMFLLTISNVFAAEAFKLAVPEDAYPPYIIMNEQQGLGGGLLIDSLKDALTALGIELEIHTVPLARSRLMLKSDKMDGVMHSPGWVKDNSQVLWLDLGLWIEDFLYFKTDITSPPQDLQSLKNAELITHMGYVYPSLDPLIEQKKIVRLERYTGEEMIDTLVAAPQGSERFMVMDKNVWQWYQQRVPSSHLLQQSLVLVGCAPLKIRLANNARMQRLQPLLQKRIKQQQVLGAMRSSQCEEMQKLSLGNK